MNEPKTLIEVIQYFSDPENCRQFMVFVRWPDGKVRCPHCGHDGVAYLEKSKLYFCPKNHPKQKFSLKVGTIFEESPIGLEKWLPASWLIANCKNGISSYELARAIGVTQKTAWFMLHRIRESMQSDQSEQMSEGPVEIDEAYIGGNPQFQHKKYGPKPPRLIQDEKGKTIINPAAKEPRGRATKKIPVMGMLDRKARKVRAQVIPQVERKVLQEAILENVSKGTTIYTDMLRAYSNLPALDFVHETVNHLNEYVRGDVHTNSIENFWSLLKRSLKGTYVAVEPFHLDRYVTEQVFRFNNRATKDNPVNDADRFTLLMSQVSGKRLTYAELTGKEGERTPF